MSDEIERLRDAILAGRGITRHLDKLCAIARARAVELETPEPFTREQVEAEAYAVEAFAIRKDAMEHWQENIDMLKAYAARLTLKGGQPPKGTR